MVFESVLSTVLNKYLGDFVENLDTNQLNVGIWGGDVELKNLVIKPSALDDLDLPVRTIFGTIGNLVLQIPWKNLYSAPTIIKVENIYLLVQPNQQIQYDPEKEEKWSYEAKKREIKKIEDAKKTEEEKDLPKADATFVERLISNIIKNIQLTVKNIHIRYEDSVTNPKSSFSLGVTLSELVVESTDSNWKPTIVDDISKIYKVVHLEGLSVYWNCNCKLYDKFATATLINRLKNEIASKHKKPQEYNYILGPINSSARLRINQRPENDELPYSIPKIHLNLDMEKLYLGISRSQYRDVMALIDSMGRMEKAAPYRKYRPNVPSYKGYYKEWWHFAYKCVLEGEVKRQRRNWDWNHISSYRYTCKEYRNLYKKQCEKKISPKDLVILESCEKKLHLTNIVIIRQEIEMELKRQTTQQTEKKGWFGWMWGSKSEDSLSSSSANIVKQFQKEMTTDEKERLYKAIGYQEGAGPTIYPEEYIDNSLGFLLRALEIELIDDEMGSNRVLVATLYRVKCDVDTRVSASALQVKVKMADFTVNGMEQEEFIPKIITTDKHIKGSLLEIDFETNPIDKKCDQRVKINALPVKIVYDAHTINRIIDIFKVPPDTTLDQLQAVAEGQMTNVKEMTAVGIQYTISKKVRLDIDIDLRAPYIIIPYGGKYTESENLLVVNLGRLRVFSQGHRSSMVDVKRLHDEGKNQQEILDYMISHCYDNFTLELTNVEVLVVQSDENWLDSLGSTSSSGMHLLNPLSVSLNYSKCLITDDPRLPLTKITGNLPSIDIKVSEARLLLLIALVTSIELPSSDVPQTQPLTKTKGSSTLLLKYKEIQNTAKQTKKMLKESQTPNKDLIQFITLEATFVMKELSIEISRQEDVASKISQLVKFKLESLEFALTQQTYNTKISLLLNSISCLQPRGEKIIDIIKTVAENQNCLFKIDFVQVDPKSPDLHSTYKSCESSLHVEFGTLNIVFHQEGLLSLLAFSNSIQENITSITKSKDRFATTRQLSVISEEFEEIKKAAIQKKKKSSVVHTIKFKLIANFEGLTVKFETDKNPLCLCSIKQINTVVILKDSYTQCEAKIFDIKILDLNPETLHKMILCSTEDYSLVADIVIYNTTEEESDKPDIAVQVSGGAMRIFFLNWFVTNILEFLNQFQAAQQAIIEASQAAVESAKQNVKDAYVKATKIALDIKLKAPLIAVPVNSKSRHALLLDLGIINIQNEFLILEMKNEEGHSAIVDHLKIKLAELRLTRVELDEADNGFKSCELLTPVTFILEIKRNLSAGWYNSIPDIEIFGNIPEIKVLISKSDYQIVMDILSGNLAEGQKNNDEIVVQVISPDNTIEENKPISENQTAVEGLESSSGKKDKHHIFLKFNFLMDQFIIDLFTGGSVKDYDEKIAHNPDSHLARFSLLGLAVKGNITTDNSLTTSVLLVNVLLDDMRKGRDKKLNRMIGRTDAFDAKSKSSKVTGSSAHLKSMIDVTFQQTKTDMFADVRIYSITFILSIDYLLKIADFFNVQSATENKSEKIVKPNTSSSTSKSVATIQSVAATQTQQMTINLKMEKPDIILVEHMDDINTNAIIVNGEIQIKLRIAGTHQVINGVVKDLYLFTCNFNPLLRDSTKCNVLDPVTISIAGSTPENKGLHIELVVTNIHLNVSPATIELLNRVMVTLTSKQDDMGQTSKKEIDYSNIWNEQEFKNKDFWYLRNECDTQPTSYLSVVTNKLEILEELCIISVPLVSVTVEAGVGTKTVPMLILETGLSGTARNWSSQLNIEAGLTMLMGYYNSRLALWEPLIEPVEVINNSGYRESIPWELKFEMSYNDADDSLSTVSPTSEESLQIPQPLASIDITSDNNLELTVTKTFLEVVQNLGKAFSEAISAVKLPANDYVEASYQVLNEIGEDITLILEDSSFQIAEGGSLENINKSSGVPLQLKPEFISEKRLMLKNELTMQMLKQEYTLHIKVNKKNCDLTLPVTRADKRFFLLNYRSSSGSDNWGIISDIKVEYGITTVTLRSILQVYNYFNSPIDVYYMTPRGNELELIGVVQPNGFLNIPLKAVYNPTNELFFAVSGYYISSTPYVWKDLQTKLAVTKILYCSQKDDLKKNEKFIIKAVGEMEQVYYENTSRHTMASTCFNIHLRPAVVLKNFLPFDIVCCVDELAEEFAVKAGDTLQLPSVDPGKNILVIRLPEYLEKEWSCRQEILTDPPEFSVWTFYSYDSPTKMALDLGMHILNKNGSLIMALYCPFWMLNKTGVMLAYRKSKKTEKREAEGSPAKSSDENLNVLHHPPHFKGPILFSFNAKNFFGKKKASIRVETGDWSDKFSIDVAGSSGVINCKTNNINYQIGVRNQLTYNGLTKQVMFTPYYVIINNAPFAIECQENDRPADHWLSVEPKSCSALWPKSEMNDKLLRLRIKDTKECSAPFLYTESHTTLLRLNNKYGGISVDIQLTEGGIYINLVPYEEGSAPAILINHTNIPITYWEKDSIQKRILKPHYKQLYTWENPSGPRLLVWDRGNKKEIVNSLQKDTGGEFSPSDDINICWATFLDGMQRVLLFTESRELVECAQAANLLVVFDQEINVSIVGIGISLVNNLIQQEIMYIGIASSGVIWETCKINSKRYKHLGTKESTQLENAYQRYLLLSQQVDDPSTSNIVVDNKMEVDFANLLMLKPYKKKIRRNFQTGLWFQMKSSPNQMQIHAKINRLQIDNQMYDCIFPVVLAPIPPPKSVAADSGIKPYIEVSIVQLLMKNSQIRQYKYFKVLIQEFHIKVDLGFVNAILELLQQSEQTDEQEKEHFSLDTKLVDQGLYSLASTQSLQEQKSFYDLLHFSPIKVHISFSMAAGSTPGQSAVAPNFLNVLLQGFGVTLTDLQDVVFKLAFFERNYTFLTQNQLIREVTSHYIGQAVKQLYVLVLGLDVIGNPYGLVIGITKGVEDLFYEPFQGAIQGPGEFAEGLALGVRSLFGQTVGGAAGAMSRITGAMGKGVAALTFDDEFQRKRREQINRKPATVQEGLARGGKGLVMGVVSGVTGVITKPMQGAKEDGVEGFFKGLGKGAVGLVARPVAGVVDFASGTLDSVKRVADTSEDVLRLRPPRFLQSDGLVRPYCRQEAEGNKILMEVSKGKFAKTDTYVAHYTIINGKEIILLTDQRLAYIVRSDIFGGWQMEWFYTWQEIVAPPKVVPKGILISTSEKKKRFFGSSDHGKTLLIGDPAKKEEICLKIESLRTA